MPATDNEEIRQRILKHFYDQEMAGTHLSIDVGEFAKTLQVPARQLEVALKILVEAGFLKGTFVVGTDVPIVFGITARGMAAGEQLIAREARASTAVQPGPQSAQEPNVRRVFVVHGRDEKLRQDLFSFLRAIGLEPIEWSKAVALTGKASPYIGEIVDAAFAHAQAVVVLFSPDDEARLRNDLLRRDDPKEEKQLTPQPRQNVLFEAGLAFGHKPDRTVLVRIGRLRTFTDILGRYEIRLTSQPETRQELANRLKNCGCTVDTSGTDWYKVGNFVVEGETGSLQETTGSKQQAQFERKGGLIHTIYKPLLDLVLAFGANIGTMSDVDLTGMYELRRDGMYLAADEEVRKSTERLCEEIRVYNEMRKASQYRIRKTIREEAERVFAKSADIEKYRSGGYEVTFRAFIDHAHMGSVSLDECLMRGRRPLEMLGEKIRALERCKIDSLVSGYEVDMGAANVLVESATVRASDDELIRDARNRSQLLLTESEALKKLLMNRIEI